MTSRDSTCMEKGSHISEACFIHITPRRDVFLGTFIHFLLEKKNRGGNKDANYGKTLQFRWKSDTADDLVSSLENVEALNGV